ATVVEKTIAQLCQHALGIREIGIDDNFFELGGDSLTAIRVIADVRAKFGMEIPIVSIYEKLTIRGLAELIANATMPGPKAEILDRDSVRTERMERRRQYRRKELLKRSSN
ncbi:MAG: phosphopantetheine-binding protein, partial [Candidatus Angelobacter sp.]